MEEKTDKIENVASGNAPEVKKETSAQGGNDFFAKLPLIGAISVLVIAGLVFLFVKLGPEVTGQVRDISLIVFALESIVTVTALVVLVVQTARLVNFLKHEVAPILTTTQKTAKKFSGTVSFLCENAVEPTVKAASTMSGVKSAASGVLSIFKRK